MTPPRWRRRFPPSCSPTMEWHGPSPIRRRSRTWRRGSTVRLVLGGGGEYYVAWYCGFFHGLLENGVDLNVAEMVVGTSAGAYAGSSLTSGEFQRLRRAVRVLRSLPRPVRQARSRDRPQHQPAAGAGDQLQRQGRQPAIHSGDRTCRAGRGQQGQWARRRAPGGISDRRQQDRLAGGQDVYHRQRLLHRRTPGDRPGGGAAQQHPARACGRRRVRHCRA